MPKAKAKMYSTQRRQESVQELYEARYRLQVWRFQFYIWQESILIFFQQQRPSQQINLDFPDV